MHTSSPPDIRPAIGRAPLFVYFVCAVASASEFIRSYDINIMSGAILFMRQEFGMGPYEEGFAMSSAIIGCLLGAITAGTVCDVLGRKRTLVLTAILYGISAVGTALPDTLTSFNLYRILGGIGIGFASVVCPLYIAEIAPPAMRGRLVMMVQFAMVFGLTTAVLTTYTMSLYGLSWRWMMASEGIPILLFLAGLWWVPESPRWLLMRRKRATAVGVIARLGTSRDPEAAVREIEATPSEPAGTYRDLLRAGTRRALVAAVGLAVLSQLVGVTTLMYYAPTLFQKTGLDASSAIARLVIINGWNILCTCLAYLLVDSLGRRPLLIGGSLLLSLGMLLTGVVFHLSLSGGFVLAVFLLCVGAYVLSVAPLTWVVVSEIFPSEIRGKAVAVATAGLWLTVFSVTQFFPPAVAHFERTFGSAAGVFWIFSAVALATSLFCWACIPETKGRTLEDIGASWGRG